MYQENIPRKALYIKQQWYNMKAQHLSLYWTHRKFHPNRMAIPVSTTRNQYTAITWCDKLIFTHTNIQNYWIYNLKARSHKTVNPCLDIFYYYLSVLTSLVCSLEFSQESSIVFREHTQVFYLILKVCNTFHSHTECIS